MRHVYKKTFYYLVKLKKDENYLKKTYTLISH